MSNEQQALPLHELNDDEMMQEVLRLLLCDSDDDNVQGTNTTTVEYDGCHFVIERWRMML